MQNKISSMILSIILKYVQLLNACIYSVLNILEATETAISSISKWEKDSTFITEV